MNMQQIRVIAKGLGLKTGKLTKVKLIHAVQIEEGNFDCFATACEVECDQAECIWRKDCFTAAKKLAA